MGTKGTPAKLYAIAKDKFHNIQLAACQFYKKCSVEKYNKEICSYFINNGTFLKLTNLCEMYRLNCHEHVCK